MNYFNHKIACICSFYFYFIYGIKHHRFTPIVKGAYRRRGQANNTKLNSRDIHPHPYWAGQRHISCSHFIIHSQPTILVLSQVIHHPDPVNWRFHAQQNKRNSQGTVHRNLQWAHKKERHTARTLQIANWEIQWGSTNQKATSCIDYFSWWVACKQKPINFLTIYWNSKIHEHLSVLFVLILVPIYENPWWVHERERNQVAKKQSVINDWGREGKIFDSPWRAFSGWISLQ